MIDYIEPDTLNDSLSEQCRDDDIGHHGYCDGLADDGLPCMCDYCRHPSARVYGSRSSDALPGGE